MPEPKPVNHKMVKYKLNYIILKFKLKLFPPHNLMHLILYILL